jgi:hypothetical protein
MVVFSYLAAITEKIEFATGILVLPQRQTALVAKQVAQIDLLSGGRMRGSALALAGILSNTRRSTKTFHPEGNGCLSR